MGLIIVIRIIFNYLRNLYTYCTNQWILNGYVFDKQMISTSIIYNYFKITPKKKKTLYSMNIVKFNLHFL